MKKSLYPVYCGVFAAIVMTSGCNSPSDDQSYSGYQPYPQAMDLPAPMVSDSPIELPAPAGPAKPLSYRDAAYAARSGEDPGQDSVPSAAHFFQSSGDTSPLKPECADKSCSEGIATLENLTIDPLSSLESKGQCNAFLVTPDIIATARHCVPADLQRAGQSCQDRIWFFFPKTQNAPAEKRDCDQIEYLSPTLGRGIKGPDYAFLKMSQGVQRHPVIIERSGLQDGQTVEIYHHETKRNPEKWRLEKIQCKVAQSTYFSPDFNRVLDTRFHLTDCPIIPGDSGSALFNTDGSVIGIMDSIPVFDTNSPSFAPIVSLGLAPSEISPSAFGTSFACIPDPSDTRSALPDDCEHFLHGTGQIQFTGNDQAAANALIAQWHAQNKDMEWSLYRPLDSTLQGLFSPVPSCVSQEKLNSMTQNHNIFQMQLPVWSLKYNSSLQLTSDAQMIQQISVSVLVNTTTLKSQGKMSVSIMGDASDSLSPALKGMFFLYNGDLSLCKDN